VKGDFSRFTFDPDKNYVETLMQQGRVQVDADWNEQQAIHRYQREVTNTDVIGLCGAPKDVGGFAIGLKPNKKDLTISKGRFYIEGRMVENKKSSGVTLTAQPFLPLKTNSLIGFEKPTQSGRYIAYLEIWERHINSDQDPGLLETALGGIDTATRKQIVWQVKLELVSSTAVCDQFGSSWQPSNNIMSGSMKADTVSVAPTSSPCIIPSITGYKGLENQLYRVEIHRGGDSQDNISPATFKWSRDNGSVTTTVAINGQTLIAKDLGRDQITLGFKANQWIEIIDERMELTHQKGVLLRVDSVDLNTREIKIKNSTPIPSVDISKPVIIRRWDNKGTHADNNGIALSNSPFILENGIELEFANGIYRSGDYWLIPARTSISSETGSIEWKKDSGNNSLSVKPHGIIRSFCPLALVEYDLSSDEFSLIPGADCRPLFPPLTDIDAEDVSFDNSHCRTKNLLLNADTVQDAINALCSAMKPCCTYVVNKSQDLVDAVNKINSQGIVNAKICIQFGIYTIVKPLVIGGTNNPKGSIVVTGDGKKSILRTAKLESCLEFNNCNDVTVRDLFAESAYVGSKRQDQNLQGALTFIDCDEVQVYNCTIKCRGSAVKRASCITVRQNRVKKISHKLVRIKGNDLRVGRHQVGLLIVNSSHIWVGENTIRVSSSKNDVTVTKLIKNKAYRSSVVKSLYSHAIFTNKNKKSNFPMEKITYGQGKQIYFRTDKSLIGKWGKLLSLFGSMPTTDSEMRIRLDLAANAVVMGSINLNRAPDFKSWRTGLDRNNQIVGSQAIVVAGSVSGGYSWIKDNYITGFLQGIRIGYSNRAPQQANPIKHHSSNIQGNHIKLTLPQVYAIHPEAIFVGSYVGSVRIESNTIDSNNIIKKTYGYHSDGIKVFGQLGSSLHIRQNDIMNVYSAIRVVPLTTGNNQRRWVVIDNRVSGTKTKVDLVAAKGKVDYIANQPGGLNYQDLLSRIEALENRS